MVFFSQRKEGIYRATIIKMNEQYKIKISRDISVSGSVHSDRSRRESVYRYLLGRYNTPPPASIYQPHPSAIQTTHFPPTLWETRMFEIPVHLWDCGVIAPHGGALCLYIKRMHIAQLYTGHPFGSVSAWWGKWPLRVTFLDALASLVLKLSVKLSHTFSDLQSIQSLQSLQILIEIEFLKCFRFLINLWTKLTRVLEGQVRK